MSIKQINMRDLLDYEGREGLILQGCGGDPQEWIDGINDLFTTQELLMDGTKFKNDECAVFDNNAQPASCLVLQRMLISIMGNLPCGVLEHIHSLAVHGYPTLWIISSADFMQSKSRKAQSPIAL